MVVLAGSICTRGGKPLISRQFRELSKDRVTSLLASFPSLLSKSDENQYTSVEDGYVRYVYQPLEEFYVVLITNKHSNILEDIDTLHLFTQAITSVLDTIDEREIFDNCFEIINAFDEIINMGYKEKLSLSQVMTFLEMESHEEKIQEIIERNKELEAAEERKRKATEIFISKAAAEIRNKELSRKANIGGFDGSSAYTEQQPGYGQEIPNYGRPSAQIPQQSLMAEAAERRLGSGRLGSATRKGGLQLGKKPTSAMGQPLLSSQKRPSEAPSIATSTSASVVKKPKITNNGILTVCNEKFSAQITRDGSISSAEVKGDLQIRINDPELSHAKLQVSVDKPEAANTQFKTHPNIDRGQFKQSRVIGMKKPTKPFPSNDQTLGVLRWKSTPKSGSDDSNVILPIMFTTWVNNNNDGTITLTFEYENVISKGVDKADIIIPTSNATIDSNDDDNASLEFGDDGVHVHLTQLLEKPESSFSIVCKDAEDEEALFPMEVSFNITKKLEPDDKAGQVNVATVEDSRSGDKMPYDSYYRAVSEGIYIV